MERFDKKKTPVLIRDKLPFSEIVKEAVKKIKQPLLLYGISESALLISLLLCGKDITKGMYPIVYTLAGLIVFIAIGHFTLEFYRGRPIVEELMDRILRLDRKSVV